MLRRSWSRIKPPVGARVTPGHPLASGLVACWLYNDRAGARADDAAGRWPGSLVGTGTTYTVNPGVEYGLSTSGVSGNYMETATAVPIVNNHWTIAIRLLPRVLAAANRFMGWAYDGPTLYQAGGGLKIVHSGTIDLEGGTVTQGVRLSLAATRTGEKARLYKDGQVVASSDAFAVTYTADTTMRVGQTLVEAANAIFDYAMAWERGLSKAEVRWLHEEPYAMLTRRPLWRGFGVAAAGGGGQAPRTMHQARLRRAG